MRGFGSGRGFEGEEGKAEVVVGFCFDDDVFFFFSQEICRTCGPSQWQEDACAGVGIAQTVSRCLFSRGTDCDESGRLGEDEADLEDKLRPSIYYLQKLGPEHLSQIFESARWVFDSDAGMGFDVSLPLVQLLGTQEVAS